MEWQNFMDELFFKGIALHNFRKIILPRKTATGNVYKDKLDMLLTS